MTTVFGKDMLSFDDYDFDNVSLLETVLLINSIVRTDFSQEAVRQQLTELVNEARQTISQDVDEDLQVEQLLELFFTTWGFGDAGGVYRYSDTLWLDRVLETRSGTAVSLGVIFLHLCEQLDLPMMPVIFPTQLILRADWLDGSMWLINPVDGETLTEHQLDVWLKGHLGLGEKLRQSDLDEADNASIIRRMLGTLKTALIQEDQLEIALQVSELILSFDPDDPYEIRDRGLIYAQLDCHHIALNDLRYFIKHCPEDPVVDVIKTQVSSMEHDIITLH